MAFIQQPRDCAPGDRFGHIRGLDVVCPLLNLLLEPLHFFRLQLVALLGQGGHLLQLVAFGGQRNLGDRSCALDLLLAPCA